MTKKQINCYISMIVLQQSSNVQDLFILPIKDEADSLVISTDRNSVTITTPFVKEGNYLKTSSYFALKEGNFYDLKVLNGTETVYLDKIFCTNQTIFSINYNKYD